MSKTLWVMPWEWAGAISRKTGFKLFKDREHLEAFFGEYKEGEMLNRPTGLAVEILVGESDYQKFCSGERTAMNYDQIDMLYWESLRSSPERFAPPQGLLSIYFKVDPPIDLSK